MTKNSQAGWMYYSAGSSLEVYVFRHPLHLFVACLNALSEARAHKMGNSSSNRQQLCVFGRFVCKQDDLDHQSFHSVSYTLAHIAAAACRHSG